MDTRNGCIEPLGVVARLMRVVVVNERTVLN
jgi:hypothetical protein